MKTNQEITEVKKEVKKFEFLPDPVEFQMYMTLAQNAAKSGLYGGIGGEEKIFILLLTARELGIPPLTALNGGLWNIKGRVEVSPKLMSAMIRRGGHSIRVIETNEMSCTLEGVRRDNNDRLRITFSMKDAIRAGLANKEVWKSYPQDMCYNRAMSRLGRLLFADCLGTAYVQGETRDDKLEEAEVEEMAEENGYKKIEEKPKPDLKEKYSMIDQTKLDFIEHCKNTWKSKTEEEILDFFISKPDELNVRYAKWIEKKNAEVILQADSVVPAEQPLPQLVPDLQQ